MTASKIIHVGFLIFPDFPMSCLTSMIEPLRAANEIIGREAFAWSLISEDGAKVTASANVVFDPDFALDAVDHVDQVFVLSGPSSTFANAHTSDGKLRKLARHGVVMGAVSGGISRSPAQVCWVNINRRYIGVMRPRSRLNFPS